MIIFLAVLLFSVYLLISPYARVQSQPLAPDGLAVIAPENAARLQLLNRFGDGVAADLAWSPDGARLAAASTTGAWVFDLTRDQEMNGALVVELPAGASRVAYAGETLIVGSGDGAILLVEAGAAPNIHRLEGHLYAIAQLEVSPDQNTLISVDNSGIGRIWRIDAAVEQSTFESQPNRGGHAAAISIDGTTAALAPRDSGGIALLSPSSTVIGQFTPPFERVGWEDGAVFAVSANGTMYTWRLDSGALSIARTPFMTDAENGILSPDGSLLARPQEDGTVRLFEAEVELPRLRGFRRGVTSIAFSPDSRLLAAGSLDGTVRLYNLGAIIRANDPDDPLAAGIVVLDGERGGHTFGVSDVAFSPDGMLLATTGYDGTIRLWGVSSDEAGAAKQSPT